MLLTNFRSSLSQRLKYLPAICMSASGGCVYKIEMFSSATLRTDLSSALLSG